MNRLKKYVASLDSYQSDKFVERTVDELNKFVERLPDGYYTLARRFTNNPITAKVFIRLKKQMHSDWGLLDRYAEFKETSLEERAEWMVRATGCWVLHITTQRSASSIVRMTSTSTTIGPLG